MTKECKLEVPVQHDKFVQQRKEEDLRVEESVRGGSRPISSSENGIERLEHSIATSGSSAPGPAAFKPISPAPVGGALSEFDAFVKEWKEAETTNPVLKQYSYKPTPTPSRSSAKALRTIKLLA